MSCWHLFAAWPAKDNISRYAELGEWWGKLGPTGDIACTMLPPPSSLTRGCCLPLGRVAGWVPPTHGAISSAQSCHENDDAGPCIKTTIPSHTYSHSGRSTPRSWWSNVGHEPAKAQSNVEKIIIAWRSCVDTKSKKIASGTSREAQHGNASSKYFTPPSLNKPDSNSRTQFL